MTELIEATFDGRVFLPDSPVMLRPDTHVMITVEIRQDLEKDKQKSFLQTAASLNLDGPSDWSENIDNYLNDNL